MNRLGLEIHADAYALSADGRGLARLESGPAALLAGTGERLRDLDLESAIQRSEDWLMPSSRSWQGFALRVAGADGRLRDRLGVHPSFTPEEVERAFSAVVDDVAFGRPVARDVVAHLVLLRELVHHGALSGIVFESQ